VSLPTCSVERIADVASVISHQGHQCKIRQLAILHKAFELPLPIRLAIKVRIGRIEAMKTKRLSA
jgi:hypothetical protein